MQRTFTYRTPEVSSRRRIYIRRPLTPPCVRFRIRRFRLYEYASLSCSVLRLVPADPTASLAARDSYVTHPSSTMGFGRGTLICWPELRPVPESSVFGPSWRAVSTDATRHIEAYDVPSHQVPQVAAYSGST